MADEKKTGQQGNASESEKRPGQKQQHMPGQTPSSAHDFQRQQGKPGEQQDQQDSSHSANPGQSSQKR